MVNIMMTDDMAVLILKFFSWRHLTSLRPED